MKKLTVFILCLLFAAAFPAAAAGISGPVRVIAIGNSLTEDACGRNLHEIAAAQDVSMVIGNLFIEGCTLEGHCLNAGNDAPAYRYRKIGTDGEIVTSEGVRISEALADEKWDAVVFQQGQAGYGKIESFYPWMGQLLSYIKKRVPETTRFLYQEAWAFANGTWHPFFEKYGRSQNDMYHAITGTTAKVCPDFGMTAIPTATAVQSLRISEVLDQVTRDGIHMNRLGCYTVAGTWFEVLTGMSVVGNPFRPAHVEEWMIASAQEAAHAAVSDPGKPVFVGPAHFKTIWDEENVPSYTLPDPLVFADGRKVRTRKQWRSARRPELLALFREEMYGKAPAPFDGQHYKLVEDKTEALGGKAIRKQVDVFPDAAEKYCLHLLIYLPAEHKGPVPVFLGINFQGNWAVCNDTGLKRPDMMTLYRRYGAWDGITVPWPVEQILDAGYGVVTFDRADADPDYDDGFQNGITPLIYREGQNYPAPDQWGAISAWAWGPSRAMDYIETDRDIDAGKVAVIGHSRLGKTALWAGACDERFGIVISNCSGAGGAALSRRQFGETVMDLNRHFPHWFCGNFRKYDLNEESLPFDQHSLLALIAPRPLYVCSAEKDAWADPYGEFLSAVHASGVYRFLGKKGLAINTMPEHDSPSMEGDIAYHIHSGVHDCNAFDWAQYIKFADKYWK